MVYCFVVYTYMLFEVKFPNINTYASEEKQFVKSIVQLYKNITFV